MKKLILLFIGLVGCSAGFAGLKEQWVDFLTTLELCAKNPDSTHASDVAIFKGMLTDLNLLQSLPLWRATTFHQAMHKQPIDRMAVAHKQRYTRTLLKDFAASYTPQARAFMQQLTSYKNTLTKINTLRGTQFNTVGAAQQLWQEMQREIIQPLMSQQFIGTFNASPFIAKVVACDVMRSCIDTIDTTIKTVKTSNALSFNEKVTQFKIMLDDFKKLFKTWAFQIMPEYTLQYHASWPLYNYFNGFWGFPGIDSLYALIIQGNNPLVFQRSANFSVNAAMLGSTTAFERHQPVTAEDMFMLIHQNSLVVVAATFTSLFNSQSLDECISIPAIVKETMNYFETGDGKSILKDYDAGTPQRIGINYTADTIELLYNITLRNHSSSFQILYNQVTQQCTLAVQFLGQARGRWEQVALAAAISNDLSGLELVTDVTLDKNAGIVSWSWNIKSSHLPIIAKYLGVMAHLSFEENLSPSMLKPLHPGASFKRTLQRAVANYQQKYGYNQYADLLK